MVDGWESSDSNATGFPFTEIGRCIYCGQRRGELTREHVLPKGLGGKFPLSGTSHALVLRRASCARCQRIIQPLEEHYLRAILSGGRDALGLKEKHRAEKIPSLVHRQDGTAAAEALELSQLPANLVVPSLRPAGILRERFAIDAEETFDLGGFQLRSEISHPDRTVVGARFTLQLNMPIFCRVMCKIAHGLLVGHLGLEGFRPLVQDFIRTGLGDHFNFVGGHAPAKQVPAADRLHRWRLGVQGGLWIVEIQLFAQFGGPVNYVVAGEAI